MKATRLEFRLRALVIGLVFWAGFACYGLDPWNATSWAASLLYGASAVGTRASDGGAGILRAGERIGACSQVVHLGFGIAAGVAVLAALLRSWATAYVGPDVVFDKKLRSATLVVDGPYRHVRNPLYLGTWLLTVSMAAMMSRLGAVVAIAGMWLFLRRLIALEEDRLETEHGEAFRRFRQQVPTLLPSLRARLPSGGRSPDWRRGVTGELFSWGFAATMVVYAAMLDLLTFYIMIAGSLVLVFVAPRLVRGTTSQELHGRSDR